MLATLPLPFYFLIGGLISIFMPKGVIKSSFVCLVPILALIALLNGTWEEGFKVQFLDLELNFMRVDKLSTVFGIIFCIAAFLGNIFAFHLRESTQPFVALIYAGAAIGAVFAGDLITLLLLGAYSYIICFSYLGAEDRRSLPFRYAIFDHSSFIGSYLAFRSCTILL